ncbi:MAG: FAD-dependent oxidoreductase [Cyclobacteriaceae bacterium]|nr:FAD-dependent oxidoreductase [Cyclobacteriaceae bacterium]
MAESGHLLFNAKKFAKGQDWNIETLIVGGGVAGLSAAFQLLNKDYLVVEMADRLGGTSSSQHWADLNFSMGAHYDLEYPETFGKEVLHMLEQMGLIYHQPWKKSWTFHDRSQIIAQRQKEQCYEAGVMRPDVLPEQLKNEKFSDLMMSWVSKMPMPTRIIDASYHFLNHQTFKDYLVEQINPDPSFFRYIDHLMRDDYGGATHEVSALAGIHYFSCRPYFDQVVDLFSPMQGNAYFVEKIASFLNRNRIMTQQMVASIANKNSYFEVTLIDLEKQSKRIVRAGNIVYAGQKNALKYVYPDDYPLFKDNKYAPWLVISFVIKDRGDLSVFTQPFWQNEMITDDPTFLGFTDSFAQQRKKSPYRVFTAYYCLPASSREDLINLPATKEVIAEKTLNYLEEYLDTGIRDSIEKIYIRPLGHAMPIPEPGYLFNDKNKYRSNERMVYAGVDNARLPLFFEAVDSGIMAAQHLF